MKNSQDVLAIVSATIRSTINEDWIQDTEITRETRFHDDLEIESIEFIRIADAVQAQFGRGLDLAGWLSGRSMQQLIALSVGDLTDAIAAAFQRA